MEALTMPCLVHICTALNTDSINAISELSHIHTFTVSKDTKIDKGEYVLYVQQAFNNDGLSHYAK